MSYDTKCYDLAKVWLANEGWTYGPDIEALAQKIQDCCEDHVAELANNMEVQYAEDRRRD